MESRKRWAILASCSGLWVSVWAMSSAGQAPAASAAPTRVESAIGVDPLDWTYWRGPRFDGSSPEVGLPDKWRPAGGPGSNLAWKRDDIGGRSTPIVMRGKLYTIMRDQPDTAREGEKVVCLDAVTGKTLWENRFNVYLSDVPDTRVGWSSCVGDPITGLIYVHGVCGEFRCIDGETGDTVWRVPLHERFGALSTYGGRTNYPVLCDDLVITSAVIIGWGEMAKPAHGFIAFDKYRGDVVWFRTTRPLPYDTTYSGPTVAMLNGQLALVSGSGDGAVWAMQPRTGATIWQYRLARRGLNTPPLVVGNRVYAGNGEENLTGTTMGAVVAIDGTGRGDITETGEVWRVNELMNGRSQPILIDNRLWVFDDRAKLHVLDAASGEAIGRRIPLGTMMRGSPLYVDGKVFVITANGRWYILKPDEKAGAKIVQKGRFPGGEDGHASPICSHGRIYILTSQSLYCLQDEEKSAAANVLTPVDQETAASVDAVPSQLQIIPAEMLVRPGHTETFQVRWFDSLGRRVGSDRDVSWSVEGPASIDRDGKLVVDAEARHAAVFVTATSGDQSAASRIRVVPDLPWRFDFEDVAIPANGRGEPPIVWVGARYRHVVRNVDGNQVMVKITTIPKGTRSRCWFGHSDLSDYVIQADVRGADNAGKLPDIGLIAQGYAVDLQGALQELQVRSWVTERRMARSTPYPWQGERWYTLKLQVRNVGSQAEVRGKVWPRDEPEPQEWTVEAIDDTPNESGSPGLYGNAKDAEIFLDNIQVTPIQ